MLFSFGHTEFFLLGIWGFAFFSVYSTNVPSTPSFAEPIPNTTATVGREAILKCTIDDLGAKKVAWIKLDTQTLLSIDMDVVSRDRRLKITNSNKRQWFLHIKDVTVFDRGYYMCQINTEPMVSQAGYLDVLVPPSIEEEGTSTDTTVEERSKVTLRCGASGYPPPHISWRRENNKDINLGSVGTTKNIVQRVEGEYLNLTQVSREDMGAYLCIASNGVPPSVSKRILVNVNFQPKIRVQNQMVYAVVGSEALLACNIEASPKPMTSWIRPDEAVLINNNKYETHETEDSYKILMELKIKNVSKLDFGPYKCVAKNTFGDKEGFVRLIEIIPTTTTTASTTIPYVFVPIRISSEKPTVTEGTTQRREYGAPTTNSLRDESHLVSSEQQQLFPGKVESRMEDEKQQKRTTDYNLNHSKKTASGGTTEYVESYTSVVAFIILIFISRNYLVM